MAIIDLTCPKCKAELEQRDNELVCPYCGAKYMLQDETVVIRNEAKIKKEEGKTQVKMRQIESAERREKSDNHTVIFIILIFLLMGAGFFIFSHFEEEKEAAKAHVTVSAKELKGENVDTVVDALYDMGFYDIDTKAEKDLVIGLVSKKDEVISVSINGDKKFKKGDAFENFVSFLR